MNKNLITILIVLIFVSNCTNMQESLSMKKKAGVDEFLIEKKNPLVLPPDYSNLPKPKDSSGATDELESDIDLSKVLENSKKTKKIKSSKDLEKSISNILNKK